MNTHLRLLVVEDSEDDTQLLLRELRRGGYDVAHQRVESDVGMRAAETSGEWDLVICDYSMPRFSGIEALRLHRIVNPDVPFIFLSGTIGEEAAVAALKEGAQDYLMKGSLGRMLPAIERELHEARERSERKKLERQVQSLQKFEAIGRLAGGIAHDFNNSLGVILGWAQLGLEETDKGSRVYEKLEIIRDQAKRAAQLTAQLLAFARQQILKRAPLNLNEQISETAKIVKSVIESRIDIILDVAPTLSSILADRVQIEQILINLCLNGRDAISKSGSLKISTQNIEVNAKQESFHDGLDAGKYVLLSVCDTGAGMDSETLDRIFEPFFTTKEMGRGTGLGLATVYGVVRQHGGCIFVDSTVGVGTTFRIYFPAIQERPETHSFEQAPPLRRGSETILLAEDHDSLRELAESILTSFGYRVIATKNGLEAVRAFEEHAREIDLVILDMMMPELNGAEALAQMHSVRSDLPAIFTSGYSEDLALRELEVDKGAVLLEKPYEPQVLSQTIRRVLDAGARRTSEEDRRTS